jgi:hypothetical protein
MVSNTLASLDAWLALADEVLAEQHEFSERHTSAEAAGPTDQLSLFPLEHASVESDT